MRKINYFCDECKREMERFEKLYKIKITIENTIYDTKEICEDCMLEFEFFDKKGEIKKRIKDCIRMFFGLTQIQERIKINLNKIKRFVKGLNYEKKREDEYMDI